MNEYFSLDEKIYEVTERYPQLIELLAENGFANLQNEAMRKTIGRTISLENALRSRKLEIELFERRMVELIEGMESSSIESKDGSAANITMAGVLPCPIRMQLLEHLDSWRDKQGIGLEYELPAASMGLDWLQERIAASSSVDELADIYLSAGFSLFFDKKSLGHYADDGAFADLSGLPKLNSCFDNDYIDLKDPLRRYSIAAVVPAVFMVNTALLGDRPFPRSWEDLLKPDFKNSIALPTRDLDLFNAVLLGIYSIYGEEGVAKLGRGLVASMHPAQMVKSGSSRQANAPVVTVMPYFFASMNVGRSSLESVWPEDGAIISPIFLLTKSSAQKKIQPLVDYFFSKEMGEVFAADGKFPVTNPEVDNGLSADKRFLWAGWDFIHNNDIPALLAETERIFYEGSR